MIAPGITQAVDGPSWSLPTNMSAQEASLGTPRLAMSSTGARVAAVWSSSGVNFASSSDGGVTWSTPVLLAAVGSGPQISMGSDGLRQTVVWERWDGDGVRIESKSTDDGGSTWSTVSELAPVVYDGGEPQVWSSGDGLKVTSVWAEEATSSSPYVTKARTSLDGGFTWSTAQTLSTNGNWARYPQITGSADGSTLAAIWMLETSLREIQVAMSSNSGSTWSSPTTLSSPTRSGSDPRVSTSGSGSYFTALWTENSQAYSATTSNAGASWSCTSASPCVSMSGSANIANTTLVSGANGGRVAAMWRSYVGPGVNRITVASSLNGGLSWSTPLAISAADQSAADPDLAMSSDGVNLIAAWRQGPSSAFIFASSSSDGGDTWSTPVTLNGANSDGAAVASSSDGARSVIAWRLDPFGSSRFIQSVVAPPAGPLTFSSGSFGSPAVGTPTSLTVTVTNSGESSTTSSAITAAGSGVSVTGGTCSTSSAIAAAETCTVNLVWTPTVAGSLSGSTLTIAYPGGAAASSALTLSGTATSGGGGAGGSTTPSASPSPTSSTTTPVIEAPTSTPAPAPATPDLGNPREVTGSQLAAIPPSEVGLIPPAEFGQISPAAFAALTPQQVAALTPGQVNAIRPGRAAELTPSAVAEMSPGQLASLRPRSVGALKPAALAGLSGEQLSALRPAAIASIPADVLARLSVQQLRALTPAQVRAMTPEQLAALTPRQRSAL